MTDYRCMFSTSDRHRKLNQLRWQNMSAHLTNETSYWLKKLLMHLNWAIYNVCDLNIDTHVCFFPTLSQDRARPIPLAQPEACPQRSERPVCARSPHRSRNGYSGWYRVYDVTVPTPLHTSDTFFHRLWKKIRRATGPLIKWTIGPKIIFFIDYYINVLGMGLLTHSKFSRWKPWWRHQMRTFSALLAISAGNSPVSGEFPAQRPVTRSFDGFLDLRLYKRLSKQSWGWWFETLSCPLWRHRNDKLRIRLAMEAIPSVTSRSICIGDLLIHCLWVQKNKKWVWLHIFVIWYN